MPYVLVVIIQIMPSILMFHCVRCTCRKNLSSAGNTSTTLSVSSGGIIAGLAFDWIHNNLYWTDAGNDCIEVLGMAADSSGHHWEYTVISTRLDEPHAVAVDPRDHHRYLHTLSQHKCAILAVLYFYTSVL